MDENGDRVPDYSVWDFAPDEEEYTAKGYVHMGADREKVINKYIHIVKMFSNRITTSSDITGRDNRTWLI